MITDGGIDYVVLASGVTVSNMGMGTVLNVDYVGAVAYGDYTYRTIAYVVPTCVADTR